MSNYLKQHGKRQVPQSEKLRKDQKLNEAGGYVWKVDPWTLMRRFLILGTEGGSYYATEFKATKDAAKSVRKCIEEDGVRAVKEIVEISDLGRAPKNDPALFALAVAISEGDKETKRAAAEALPKVARIGTHLYHFVAYAETMRGWGRTMRWAVSNWYSKNPEQLAYQAVKYRQRDGWSHRDLLRLAHPKNDENASVFEWIVRGGEAEFPIVEGFEKAQLSPDPENTAKLVREFNLPREALLTEHLNSPVVWEALLEKMPMHAMVRNLATMTRSGLLVPGSDAARTIRERLADQDLIRKARVHPMALFLACRTYAAGHGLRGRNTWNPVASIVDALDGAFYLAFGNVTPTNKKVLIGIDSSGSMHGSGVAGVPGLTAGEASCAQALVFIQGDPDSETVLFDTKVGAFPLTPKMRLDTIYAQWRQNYGGGTNCALPFMYAHDRKREVDAFLTLTDSQTWHGQSHPVQVLKEYRDRYGPTKYVEVQMVANRWSTGDELDPATLRMIGFDASMPELVSGFVRDEF